MFSTKLNNHSHFCLHAVTLLCEINQFRGAHIYAVEHLPVYNKS